LNEGGSLHTFRMIRPDQSEYAISKMGPHCMGDRLFRDTGTFFPSKEKQLFVMLLLANKLFPVS